MNKPTQYMLEHASSKDTSSETLPVPSIQEKDEHDQSTWRGQFKRLTFKSLLKRETWNEEVDPTRSVPLLLVFCLMTGWIDAITFSASFIWVAFQTGNTIQNAVAVARFFSGPTPHHRNFQTSDAQALTSLLAFIVGVAIGRLGDKIGPHRRHWLVGGTTLQALLTMAAAITIYHSKEPGPLSQHRAVLWRDVYGFVTLAWISASMGLQGIMAKRLNTPINASVVLTTTWVELISEPTLFKLGWSQARDLRFLMVVALFIGAVFGRLAAADSNSAVGFGVAAGIRMLVAIAWLFMPRKPIDLANRS